jgi:hypothetical protein
VTVKATIKLDRDQLWELICNFEASYEAGAVGNEVADSVALVLRDALQKLKKDTAR